MFTCCNRCRKIQHKFGSSRRNGHSLKAIRWRDGLGSTSIDSNGTSNDPAWNAYIVGESTARGDSGGQSVAEGIYGIDGGRNLVI